MQTVQFGSQGSAVRQLQSILNGMQSAMGKLVEDGVFGQGTRRRVLEFQGKCHLLEDGIVGPNTWKYLLGQTPMPNGQPNKPAGSAGGAGSSPAPVPDATASTGAMMPASMPANEKAAREKIIQIAQDMFNRHGGWKPGDKPSLSDPRVAGKLCADPATRARQGGKTIHEIFTVAGAPNPQRCLTLSPQAEAMYNRSYTASERNNTDIVSWCGIFSLYVHKMAGLRLNSWPLKYSIGKAKAQDEYRIVQWPQPGDIGVVEPMGLNHHFVVTSVSDSGVTSVDGNAGWYMEIVKQEYSKTKIKQKQGYFLTPIWEKVL